MSTIAENLESIRARIAHSCQAAGRSQDEVRLLAVTKFVDISRISEAVEAGIAEVGENRAQELDEKLTFFENAGLKVHFIGQLQTNKLKYVCGKTELIQSVDRPELAALLQSRAASMGVAQNILLQVNIGNEPQKGGVPPEDCIAFAEKLAECSNLRVSGLMCVPPDCEGEAVRPYFRKMRALYEAMRQAFPALPISLLSMGMSHDFEIAIQEGATMVRIGSALFGKRRQ